MNFITALLVLLTTFAAGCKSAPKTHPTQTATTEVTQTQELVILATTDFHAALDRAEAFAVAVREVRAKYGNRVIHLDGGDLFQGSLEGNMSKGRSIVEFYNLLGTDAVAIGNHELDYGPDVAGRVNIVGKEDGLGNIKARAREAKFQWLSANFVQAGKGTCKPGPRCNALGQRTLFAPRAEFERAGQKVCVIGATTPTTKHITWPAFVKGVRFEELAPVVTAEAKYSREKLGCQYVLVVSHAGLLCNKEGECKEQGHYAEILRLLQELPRGTLDAVVAGHTHLKAQEIINGTPVIEAGSYAKTVGVLKLLGSAQERKIQFEPFIDVPESVSADAAPDVTKALALYREAAKELKARPVGETTAPFVRAYNAENALGNFVADALLAAGREAQGAQFALMNAGGIRADLPSGRILYDHVFKVMPFDNSLAVVDIKGSELIRLLEVAHSGAKGMPPIAGLHLRKMDLEQDDKGPWDRDLNGDGKKEVWERDALLSVSDERGQPIDEMKTYRLVTMDFLTNGGDLHGVVYDKIPKSRIRVYSGIWVRDLLVDYFKKNPVISPEMFFSEGRRRIELVKPR